ARVLEAFVQQHPADRNARYLLGLSWQQSGNMPKAQEQLVEILRRDPKWAPGQYALARVYFFAGRFDDAIASAQLALGAGEPAARVYHLIGSVEEERGRLDAALSAFTKADGKSGQASV